MKQTPLVPIVLAIFAVSWLAGGAAVGLRTAIAASPAAPPIESAEDLLDHLERADDDVGAITARVQYDRRFRLQGDRHRRRGDLYFKVEDGPQRKRTFAINFDTMIVGDRLQEDESEIWVFDGEWLVEKKPKQKQFIKRRVAPPDADFDPLAIGEGPMPIPIGQEKEDILARYDAELRPADDLFQNEEGEGIRRFVEGTVQLRLTPRAPFDERADLKEIRLWYRWHEDADRFLPRMARTVNRSGDESYVQLIRVQVRERGESGEPLVSDDVFDVAPPPPGRGWQIEVIDELRGERADAEQE